MINMGEAGMKLVAEAMKRKSIMVYSASIDIPNKKSRRFKK